MRRKLFLALAAALVCTGGRTVAQEAAAPAAAPTQPPSEAAAPTTSAPAERGPIPYATFQRQQRARAGVARPTAQVAASAAGAAGGAARPAAVTAAAGQPVAGAPPQVAALPTTGSGARLSPDEALPPAELEAFVDGVVKAAMARDHIAGATVAIVQDGQVVLKKGYGFASLSPQRRVDSDRTLFRVGSISKTFTWIALMNEVEAGRIRIDAPANLYLPERLQIRDQGFRTPVRVTNLMDHSPGFEDRMLGHLFERNYDRVRPLAEYLRQERPRRVAAPGAVSSYSNYGAALAGEMLVYVTGKPFETLIEDEILRPLAMSRTTFREPHPAKAGLPAPMSAALAKDVSDGYRWTPEGLAARPYEFIEQVGPAGAACSMNS